MAESRLKLMLQGFAVRTQFPPFVWLWRLVYAAATRLCTCRLARLRGLRALYLLRGMTHGRPVWGLSDIDMIALVEHEEDAPAVKAAHRRLGRFAPMLAGHEIAVWSRQRLRLMYRHSPWTRSRFDSERPHWRRLWGEDLNAVIPPFGDDRRDVIWEELFITWGYFLLTLSQEAAGSPRWYCRYTLYKLVAETARYALVAGGGDPNVGREEALDQAIEAFPDIAPALRELRRGRRRLAARTPLPLEGAVDAMIHLGRRALENQPAGRRFPRRVRLLPLRGEPVRLALGEAELANVLAARRAVGDLAERAVLAPLVYFRPYQRAYVAREGHLRGDWLEMFLLVFVARPAGPDSGGPPRRPPVETFRLMLRLFALNRRRVTAVWSDGRFAFAMNDTKRLTVGTPATRPDAFPDLRSTVPFADGVELAGARELDLPLRHPDDLTVRAATMVHNIAAPSGPALTDRQYSLLFWEAGRMAWLVQQADRAVAELPVLCEQVAEALVRLTPEAEPGLRAALRDYVHVLRGEPAQMGRHRDWMRRYALGLPERVPAVGEVLDRLWG